MDMTTDHQRRPFVIHCFSHCGAASILSVRGQVQNPLWWRMGDEDRAGRTICQQGGGFCFGEVVAPGTEGRHGHTAAKSVEVSFEKAHPGSVQDDGAGPTLDSLQQFIFGFVVAWDEHGGTGNLAENVQRSFDSMARAGEITGTHNDIDLSGLRDQPFGG